MMKKIPDANIVKGSKRVLPAGHPLLALYDPSEVIIVGEISEYDSNGKQFPIGTNVGGFNGGNLKGNEDDDKDKKKEDDEAKEKPDVPQLSDIESIEYVKYFDAVTKVEKVKAIIKIRNSSINKNKIAGVDARIAPLGA
jgi:hypothetical protein